MEDRGRIDEDPGAALLRAYPELAKVREAAAQPVYVVGGAVRDLLLGRGRSDLDLVVEGDPAELATRLGAEATSHERFGTAKLRLDGHEIDIATARTETYPEPGSLPEVTPARLGEDLARRDFTINAMAVPLDGGGLIDPHGGREDLADGLLRVLHDGSFRDDPTRALRAARYASRLGFAPEEGTEALLRASELATVSPERRNAELLRLAAEADAPRGFELLAEWGLERLRPGGVELARAVGELLADEPWASVAHRPRTVLAAALGPAGAETELAKARPRRPSEAVDLARGRDGEVLAIARVLGAEWLDRYVSEWHAVELEIDGGDLIGAGVPQGPAVGRGLDAALRRKLDGEVDGREEELAAALEIARS